jgi:hypothetical protein
LLMYVPQLSFLISCCGDRNNGVFFSALWVEILLLVLCLLLLLLKLKYWGVFSSQKTLDFGHSVQINSTVFMSGTRRSFRS